MHLTSDRSAKSEQKRVVQLKDIADKHMERSANLLVVGDFNYDDIEEDMHHVPAFSSATVDIWRQIKPGDAGFTFDPKVNTMAQKTTIKNKQRRLDRIVMKRDSHLLKPVTIEMIGSDPTTLPSGDIIFPSDHYGLQCDFELSKTPPPIIPKANTRSNNNNSNNNNNQKDEEE